MKKVTASISALIIGLVVVSGTVFAFGFPGFGLNSESREAIMNAIKANDYNAWKEAMTSTLTDEQFNKIVEMNQKREAVNKALEEGNYTAWKDAVENLERPKITDIITEENFNIFVQLYKAKIAGDYETVKKLSEELGIENYGGGMEGKFGGRMRGGMGEFIPLKGG